MPRVGDIWESLQANEFVLIIDGTASPGVSKISGLSEGEVDTIEQPSGGTSHVFKIAGTKVKYEPLIIERYVDGSPEDQRFLDWVRLTFRPGQPALGSTARKNGMIQKLHNGQVVLTFAFFNAWLKSSKFTDLEAGSTNTFKQTIVLEHEGLERV
jgi:phage tail-like protein